MIFTRWCLSNIYYSGLTCSRYYLLFGDEVKAFPPGFQMIAGDAYRRNFTLPVPDPPKSEWHGDDIAESSLRQKALGFNCLNYAKQPEPTLFRHFLPDKAYLDENCPDGVRFELMFPSCWNGEKDSTDHMSHIAYPDQVITGNCPEGFNQRLVSMLYETIWDTNAFKGKDGRFVLANGDPTGIFHHMSFYFSPMLIRIRIGYGYHGDFITGWDPDFLQKAINTCTNPSGKVEDCPLFELQSQVEQNKCNIDPLPKECADEDTKGPRQGLPGDVNIQSGPAYAKKLVVASSQSSLTESTSAVTSAVFSALSTNTNVPTLSYTSTSDLNSAVAVANVMRPSENIIPDTDTTSTIHSSTEVATISAESSTISASMSLEFSASPTFASMTSYVTNGTMVQVYIVQETVSVTVTADVEVTTEIGTTARYQKRALGVHHHGHRHVHNRGGFVMG